MKRLLVMATTVMLGLVLAACGGGGGGTPAGGNAYSQLSFDIVTNPGSTVQASAVSGQYANMSNTAFAWVQGQLPSGSTPIEGILLSPATPAGSGFSGILSAKLDTAKGTSAVWANQPADVYAADLNAHTLAKYAIVDTGADGGFNLPLNFLGFLVFASNPNGVTFTVAAFADQASTSTGTVINFHATCTGGDAPIAYTWDYGDGATATGDTTAHAYTAAGSYNVALRATDGTGHLAPAVSTPILVASTGPALTGVTVVVTPGAPNTGSFDFAATATGGTAPLSFFWDFAGAGSGPDTATTATGFTTHVFATPALYTGTVKVTDATGASVTSAPFTCDARSTPVLTALSVPEGAVGDKLTVTGNHFGTQAAGDAVMLGTTTLTLDPAGAWTDTSIDLLIPAGATNGNVVVHKTVDSNALPFKVLPAPPTNVGGGQV